MAHAGPAGSLEERPATSSLNRRRFLHVGAACVVPLLAGASLGESGGTSASAAGQPVADPVMDHVGWELMRVYRGMLSAEGVKGEHVRSLAANIDLVGAHLQSRGDDRWLDANLRERVRTTGHEAFAQEITNRYGDIAAMTAERYRVSSRVQLEPHETGEVLDLMRRRGLAVSLREATPDLVRLAARIDRTRSTRDAGILLARQKPGDDFLGYQDVTVLSCNSLLFTVHLLATGAWVLGLFGVGPGAGIVGLAAEAVNMLRDYTCSEMEAL